LALRPAVLAAIDAADRVFRPPADFEPGQWRAAVRISATDHVHQVLGPRLDPMLRSAAPRLDLRMLPITGRGYAELRAGALDLAIGVWGSPPGDIQSSLLFEDCFVCVMDAQVAVERLDLDAFCALEHVLVAPRGTPGGRVDQILAEHGRTRRVARTTAGFLDALLLVRGSRRVCTISARLALTLAPLLGLRVLPTPFQTWRYAISMVWHQRLADDPAQGWFRAQVQTAAAALPALDAALADLHVRA
jgi:DNA-binding transcriptional LysR family regulator